MRGIPILESSDCVPKGRPSRRSGRTRASRQESQKGKTGIRGSSLAGKTFGCHPEVAGSFPACCSFDEVTKFLHFMASPQNIQEVFNASSKIDKQLEGIRPCRSHAIPRGVSESDQLANDQEEKCKSKSSGMHAVLRKRREVPAKLQTVGKF